MAEKGTSLKDKTAEDLRLLSRKGRKEVEDFISFLRAKEELEATSETLTDSDFVKSIMKGEEDFKAGRYKSWKAVKDDV
ncbi:MAG: hypothetical protein HZA22_06385 [Nitrospirae bacterium]|nr:hypothetical protein [Nitrospirota bacterium]